MEIEGKLSHSQTACVTYGSAMGNIIYTFTAVTAVTGRPFWVAVLIGVLLNIPLAIWILFLGSYKKNGTLFDLLKDGLGKWVCKGMIVLYILINIAVSVCMLNMFGATVKTFFLPRTPIFVIILFTVFMCTIFANSGLKYLGRLISLLCVLATLNYFIGFSVSFVNEFRIEYVTPIFDASYAQFVQGMMLATGLSAECLLFLMLIIGSIPQTQKHYLSVIKGLFFWSIILSSAILIMEGNVGRELLSNVTGAGITIASIIQIGSFVRGLEIFILMTYQYIAALKITIYLYSCWEGAKNLFDVKRGRPILILTALAVFIASSLMNSYSSGYSLSVFLGSYVILPFVFLILLLGTISVFIIKSRNGKTEK
jgi:spore germination protein KB